MQSDWSNRSFETLACLINLRTGFRFGPGVTVAAEAGISRAMMRAGVDAPDDYLHGVQTGKLDLGTLIDEISVGESYFFRQPNHFRVIRDRILPEVEQRYPAGPLRAWSAGCAAGEEPYSLAILLDEIAAGERWRILATDMSHRALQQATLGIYRTGAVRDLGMERLWRYFAWEGDQAVLDPAIRQRVAFRTLNLATDDYPSAATGTRDLHLILCRNVLIYLDDVTIERVARSLFDGLADGGWLLTGASDPDLGRYVPLETVYLERGIAYRKNSAKRASRAPAVVPMHWKSRRPPVPATGTPQFAAAG